MANNRNQQTSNHLHTVFFMYESYDIGKNRKANCTVYRGLVTNGSLGFSTKKVEFPASLVTIHVDKYSRYGTHFILCLRLASSLVASVEDDPDFNAWR